MGVTVNHDEDILIILIDLFCGAGGVSEGFAQALNQFGNKIAYCAVAVNHSETAIASHTANHPDTLHLEEDIRLANVHVIKEHIDRLKKRFPNAKVVIWMSAECTNFSNAKGGMPRDAKSRTLARSIFRYETVIKPDFLYVENVSEFQAWGPMIPKMFFPKGVNKHFVFDSIEEDDRTNEIIGACCLLRYDKKKKHVVGHFIPESRTKGKYYLRWIEKLKSLGYNFDFRILNCADYGAVTIRKRYFAIFARTGLPICWPEQTHAEKPETLEVGLFAGFEPKLKPWRAVKEVLVFEEEGDSILGRKEQHCENTLERIHAGLEKFVRKGEPVFICKHYSGHPESKNYSINGPAHTITCIDHNTLVTPKGAFIQKYYNGSVGVSCLDQPAPTITTKDRFALVQPIFWIDRNFRDGGNLRSIEAPAGALLTTPKMNLVKVVPFLDRQFGKSRCNSVDKPCGALLTEPKTNLVTAYLMSTNFKNIGSSIDRPAPTITADRHWCYLVNPQYNSAGGSVHKPCFTLIARMDKAPPQVVSVTEGLPGIITVDPGDTPWMKRIKEFMIEHNLEDIRMRMLKVLELKRITGFRDEYILKGNQNDQKEAIGNAVPVEMSLAFAIALGKSIAELTVA